MPKTPRQHAHAIRRWAKHWGTPGLTDRVRIVFSTRLKKTLGRVRPKSGVITLHASLATAPRSAFLEVLCHEAAHVAAYLLHGARAKPHGPEWRELIRAAGYQPTLRLPCPGLPKPDQPAGPLPKRQQCLCPSCGEEYFVRHLRACAHCDRCFQQGKVVRLELASSR